MNEKIYHKHGCENTKCLQLDPQVCSRFVVDQTCSFCGQYFFKMNPFIKCENNPDLFHDFIHKDS